MPNPQKTNLPDLPVAKYRINCALWQYLGLLGMLTAGILATISTIFNRQYLTIAANQSQTSQVSSLDHRDRNNLVSSISLQKIGQEIFRRLTMSEIKKANSAAVLPIMPYQKRPISESSILSPNNLKASISPVSHGSNSDRDSKTSKSNLVNTVTSLVKDWVEPQTAKKIKEGYFLSVADWLAQSPKSAEASSQRQNDRKQAAERKIELTLNEAIGLVIANNREVKNQFLERIAQKEDLAVSENKFAPTITPSLGLSTTQIATSPGTSQVTAAARVDLVTPIGTSLTLTADPAGTQRFKVEVTQPLLKGAGNDVNEASVKIGRLSDRSRTFEVKNNLINRITSAITEYRTVLQQQEAVRIQELALSSNRRQLEITQVLIEAGRRPAVDIVQQQQNIANTEAQLLQTKNDLAQAKSTLLRRLDIDRPIDFTIPVAQNLVLEPPNLDAESLIQTAFTKRPDYLQKNLEIEINKQNLLIAENNKQWGLDLKTSGTIAGTNELTASLILTRTFNDRNLEQRFQRERINLLQNQNQLASLNLSLKSLVEDAVRNTRSAYEQVNKARQNRELAERSLTIAQTKFRLGKTDIFEVVSLQQSLVTAQNAELQAKISYLNALTILDQTVGTTLDTWKISVE